MKLRAVLPLRVQETAGDGGLLHIVRAAGAQPNASARAALVLEGNRQGTNLSSVARRKARTCLEVWNRHSSYAHKEPRGARTRGIGFDWCHPHDIRSTG